MKNKKTWSFCETPQEKCTMNYCDDNGCQNRKRHLVNETDNAESVPNSSKTNINLKTSKMSKEQNIMPEINIEALKLKANEYAQKGAEQTLKDFYTGYNSPYMEALKKDLEGKAIGTSFELPDIVSTLNEFISTEVDKIANTAVAKTFLPVVTELLTRGKKEANLSDILKGFISKLDFDHDSEDMDEYTIEIYDRHEDCNILRGSFVNVKISNLKNDYDLSFHRVSDKKEEVKRYTIMSLPNKERTSNTYAQTMKVSLDGATLELPFTKSILSDPFTTYIARYILSDTKITFDVDDFNEDMFPEREHCHC